MKRVIIPTFEKEEVMLSNELSTHEYIGAEHPHDGKIILAQTSSCFFRWFEMHDSCINRMFEDDGHSFPESAGSINKCIRFIVGRGYTVYQFENKTELLMWLLK